MHLSAKPLFLKPFMIAYVRGEFAILTPSVVVVDVNGVGYELQISLNTYSSISNEKNGTLFTYLHITENSQTLFGFFEKGEKDLFLQLISVSGVGASTARMMLSGLKPAEIQKAITEGNTRQLESIKGIGKKTAERIIVELRDKLGKMNLGNAGTGIMPLQVSSPEQDALDALMALGIGRSMAEAAIKKVFLSNTDLTLENTIKLALKNL